MILLTHPTGNANVRNALLAFEEAGLLGRFSTTLAVPGGCPVFARRSYPLPWNKLAISPWWETLRLASARLGLNNLTMPERGWACVDKVYESLDRKTARLLKSPAYSAVYAYEDGALECLRNARRMNKGAIYELPIAYGPYARKLIEVEAKKRPDWAFSLGGLRDSEIKMARKRAELEAADLVIVPSRFVLNSLPDSIRASRACAMVPYGADPAVEIASASAEGQHGCTERPLRLLFVGALSQRKGLADLLDACASLQRRDVELHLLGSAMAPLEFYRKRYPDFIHHPPCSRGEVIATMLKCDVLVLPSLVEGRALVQLEALSCGLPILITPNTGGDDLLVEGETGFCVPPSSPGELAERIAWLADHREALAVMRKAAQAMAGKTTWNSYREKLVETVRPWLRQEG